MKAFWNSIPNRAQHESPKKARDVVQNRDLIRWLTIRIVFFQALGPLRRFGARLLGETNNEE